MSGSRRPSITIYNYPEHLNPFNEDLTNSQPQIYRENKTKDSKTKFWTFGRSRKKRSSSFSIKSAWSGLFGKRKESPDIQEKRSTITTVSSTYKREPYTSRPSAPSRISKDLQEFDEALATLARRRKYTLDNSSSRYSSSLTVNGDPARIYDGSPQDTTASIMGDLTPKPPARRFGQVSPKPTDKIPPLDYGTEEPKENGSVTVPEKTQERTPVPPLRRFGNRSSQRLNASNLDPEEEANRSGDVTLRDENENVPEDYVFKRFSQDAVRRSNLSINSCVSVGSTTSGYGRKKRRAPQPPQRKEQLETPEENVAQTTTVPNIELKITEPIDIARVTENIDEMTKKSKELIEKSGEEAEKSTESPLDGTEKVEEGTEKVEEVTEVSLKEEEENTSKMETQSTKEDQKEDTSPEKPKETLQITEPIDTTTVVTENDESTQNSEEPSKEEDNVQTNSLESKKDEEEVQVEYRRASKESLEIIKDVDQPSVQSEEEEVCLRRKGSSGSLSRSDSFSVKDEIEKIERQIKALESRNSSKDSTDESNASDLSASTRQSILMNRKHFFQNMVDDATENGKSPLKIEFKELPREQNIHVVRLTDGPVPVVAPREPVKVIELHISEPIRQKAEILEDVNPIPKPRRHSAQNLNGSRMNMTSRGERRSLDSSDRRGKSF